jgi:ABC-type Mn2+/Zn2+ transport system permease subunit
MGEVWADLVDPFGEAFFVHAVVAVVLLGIAGGLLGTWIVLFGVSYSAESLAHGMFPGLVAAALLDVPILAGGTLGVAVSAVAIAALVGVRGLDRDTAVGVVVTGAFGLGALLALAPASPPGIEALLFGDVLAVSTGDLLRSAVIVAAVVVALRLLHGRLLIVGFDRTTARALGIAPRPVELALLLLVASAVLVGVQVLGSLLVVAALVAPAAAARVVAHRVVHMMAVAVAIAVGGSIVGLYVSYYASTAAGASITLALVALYGCVLVGDAARRPARRP